MSCILLALAVLTLSVSSGKAQVQTDTRDSQETKDTEIPIKLTGEFGSTGELYSKSSGESYRPSSSGRMFFRPQLTLLNNITINSNIILSTEGSSRRQKINQIELSPKWRWVELNIGGFSKKYSDLTLNGLRITGAGVELSPGVFRAGVLSGSLRRAVNTVDGNRSYKREITGGHFGFESKSGNSFQIYALRVIDDTNSIEEVIPEIDTTFGTDTLNIDSVRAPESVTPQENVVLATAFSFNLLQKRLNISSEIGGSIHSRDIQAATFDEEILPERLDDIVSLNISTTADYAVTSRIRFTQDRVSISVGQKYYRPGFVSLGLPGTQSDKVYYDFRSRYQSSKLTFQISGSTQHDNLIQQKVYTTNRLLLNSRITVRLAPCMD